MDWQLLVAGNAVLVSIRAIATRAMAREKYAYKSSFAVAGAVQVVSYIGVLAIVPLVGTVDGAVFGRYWLWFLGGGLVFALNHIFIYKLMSFLDAAISTLLSTMGVIFTVVFAGLILHEALTVRQAVGGVILFLAVAYAVLIAQNTKHHSVRRAWLWGLAFAVLASITFGLAMTNEKFLLGRVGVPNYLVFGWGGQALMGAVIASKGIKKQIHVFRYNKIFYLTILSGLVTSLSGYMLNQAEVRSDNVALVSVSSNIKIVLIILAGALFLKERRKIPQKLLAAFIAILALSIIFYG